MRLHYYLLIATFFFTSGTVATPIPEKVNLFGLEPKRTDPPQCTEQVFLGIDLLQEEGFKELQGKRVALLSHKAAVNREGILTATILHENQLLNNYTFTTIFTPEHGFAADVAAGEKITDCEISTQSQYPGVQIHTLYGNILKPSPEMLKEIDLLVIDLQTLGVRYYTYSATARFAMEACFENGVSVLVLDRPNPHGGLYIEGPIPEIKMMTHLCSGIRVPTLFGLTLGETLLMAADYPEWGPQYVDFEGEEERTLLINNSQREKGTVTVKPMRGWTRDMLWQDTGLEWVATSPNLANLSSVLGYPMTENAGEMRGGFHTGVDSPYPFRFLSFPGKTGTEIKEALDAYQLPGLEFEVLESILLKEKCVSGVYVVITDLNTVSFINLNFALIHLTTKWRPEVFENPESFWPQSKGPINERLRFCNMIVGIADFFETIGQNLENWDFQNWITQSKQEAEAFRKITEKYHLPEYEK